MRCRAARRSVDLRPLARGTALIALALSGPLAAQAVEEDSQRLQSVLALEREGYQPRQIKLGGIVLSPELDVSSIYDSNIYAAHSNRQGALVTKVQPRLIVESSEGRVQWHGQLAGEVRRYRSASKENSESYSASGTVAAALVKGITATGTASYRRAVENRSDPEVRQNPNLGPPLFNVASGEFMLRGGRGKLSVSIKALVENYDFVSRANDDRDFTSSRGSVRLLYQVAPAVSAFIQGYANKRDFRLRDPILGVSRDGSTLGALTGVQIDPGGKVRGDIGVGLFRYRPVSSLFQSFSGFAIDGNLIYAPRPRLAVIVDVFRGDVATVRNGASGRIDSRARIAVQQEIRHNLLSTAAVRFRQTHYRGVSEKLTTIGGDLDLEYLIDHHFSIALAAQMVKRTSGTVSDRFERARVGLELRFRY